MRTELKKEKLVKANHNRIIDEIQKAQGQEVSTEHHQHQAAVGGSGVRPFEAINNNDNICNNINKKTIRVNNMPQKTECLRLFSQPSAKCFLNMRLSLTKPPPALFAENCFKIVNCIIMPH